MKKFISVLVVFVMALMSTSTFALAADKPARVSYDGVDAKVESSWKKADTTGATVAANVDTYSGFGAPDTIFDEVGMVGTVEGTTWSDPNTNRWTTNNGTFTLTIEFHKDVTFSQIKFTEFRKVIETYEITGFKDGVEVGKYSDSLTDKGTSTQLAYERTIDLDGNITVDTITFKGIPYSNITNVISICEMELWAKPVSASCDVPKFASGQDISAIVDGTGMDSVTQGWDARWGCNASTNPEITISFSENITFNTIKFYEVRKEISKCTITCYSGDNMVLDKYEYIFPDGSSGITSAYLRSVPLPKLVTADKVVFKVTGQNASNVISIQEMEFWNSVKAPTVIDANGVSVAPQSNFTVDKMFDGAYTIDGNQVGKFGFIAFDGDNNNAQVYKTPITISFDLGSEKTFNYAELAELRCVLGEIDVLVSSDGDSYKKVGTMPKMEYNGSTGFEAIHSVSFDSVTARYVRYVIKEMATFDEIKGQGSQKAVTINEISLYDFPEIDGKAVIYPVYARGNVFNIDTDSYTNANNNITIKNTSGDDKEYILIGAAYNADGTLSNVYKNNVTVEANKTRTFTQNVAADKNNVKIFVWDINLAPLVECLSLEKTTAE